MKQWKGLLGGATLVALLSVGASAQAQSTITLVGTVRDFLYNGTGATVVNGVTYTGHQDFENLTGDDRNMVSSALGADNKPVYASSGTTTTTHGAALYNQWYNTTANVNLATTYNLVATKDANNNYVYSNSAYFPVDSLLLGNQGASHNYSFTTEIHTNFTYQSGQVFSFTGDDDVWVFINKKLAIDLGGVHGSESASVDLGAQASTLGITQGQTYQLDIFQAERHTTGSNFGFTTNIVLANAAAAPEPGSIALALIGALPAIGLVRRRKAQA